MITIDVTLKKLEDRSYEILIGQKCLDTLSKTLEQKKVKGDIFIITDENVSRLWAERIKTSIGSNFSSDIIQIPAGEDQKNLTTIEGLARKLVKMKADRSSTLMAVGGGVIGDITGFLASVYMRGVPFINIPTTLLAQVDSSVGGKTGVDLPEGKNLVGTFYQPSLVFTDVEFLSTLPDEEFLNGMAEVIKYGIILNEAFFTLLERNISKVLLREPRLMLEIVSRSCTLKRDVVEKDEKESGLRRILNFGHTIGHSIEAASNYTIKHGWAVAMGMVAASHIALEKGLIKTNSVYRIERLIKGLGLPVRIPNNFVPEILLEKLTYDKKRVGSTLHWVLPVEIGRVEIVKEVTHDEVLNVIKKLQDSDS